MVLKGSKGCQLATTSSTCPSDGRGPKNVGNIGNLDPKATCGKGKKNFKGCFIKNVQGTYLLLVIYYMENSVHFTFKLNKV